jgi:hypothetical protein
VIKNFQDRLNLNDFYNSFEDLALVDPLDSLTINKAYKMISEKDYLYTFISNIEQRKKDKLEKKFEGKK